MELTAPALPSVAVVVLTWNNVMETIECLTSVYGLHYSNREIILVDNGSSKRVIETIRRTFPNLTILELRTNLGFSEGNNVALRYALRRGYDYVFLLNNDTKVSPDLLTALVQFAEDSPCAGLVGPAVLWGERSDVVYALGGSVSWSRGRTWSRGRGESYDLYRAIEKPERVDFVPGCGMLVRKRFIEAVGFLDPEYFFDFEEIDWAVRGQRFGFEAWCLPLAVMWHKGSVSLGMTSPANSYYMTRNALRFFWRRAPGYLRWVGVSRIVLRTLRTVAAWTVKPGYSSERYRRGAKANILALRDFFLGRYGKMGNGVARTCGLSS